MSIHFACPNCASVMKIADRKAGAEVSCPKCGQRIIVPTPDNAHRPGILVEDGPPRPEPEPDEVLPTPLPPPPLPYEIDTQDPPDSEPSEMDAEEVERKRKRREIPDECPFCLQQLISGANKCPHCLTWLYWHYCSKCKEQVATNRKYDSFMFIVGFFSYYCVVCKRRVATERDCFIATAATGSPNTSLVRHLRQFRDGVMIHFSTGRYLVRQYYEFSPAIAKRIKKHSLLRVLTWIMLIPVAGIATTWNRHAGATESRMRSSRSVR